MVTFAAALGGTAGLATFYVGLGVLALIAGVGVGLEVIGRPSSQPLGLIPLAGWLLVLGGIIHPVAGLMGFLVADDLGGRYPRSVLMRQCALAASAASLVFAALGFAVAMGNWAATVALVLGAALVFFFALPALPAAIAAKKGYSRIGFYVLGVLNLLIALVIALVISERPSESRS